MFCIFIEIFSFMKRVILSFALLYSVFSHSQLFVSTNSYMYVGNQYVFVKQNVQLETDAKIVLRREGQFLQGTTGTSTNLGLGKLSVFQEGSVNNFAYNYWCSPVGSPSSLAKNENFGITMLEQPTSVLNGTSASMLSMTATNGISNPLQIAPRWIHRFLSGAGYSNWIQSGSNTDIEPGQGFTMKGTGGVLDGYTPAGETSPNNPGSAQRYDFRGKPNDGDITITVADGMFTLTGNPYPSAMDLSAFLTDAINTTGVAYFWEQDKTVNSHLILAYRGGYGTYSPVSRGGTGVYVPAVFNSFDISGVVIPFTNTSPNNSYARYFSPIGQGFMVKGNASGTTAILKNSYRVFQKEDPTLSVFERNTSNQTATSDFLPYIPSVSGFDYTSVSSLPVPQIRINALLNNQAIKQFVIAFDNEATDGMDHAKDAENPNTISNDINFLIENKDCVLSVIQFDENKRLPLTIKSGGNVSFKLKVIDVINFNPSQKIYLYDAETNLYHDIKDDEYEFVLPQGTYNNRFEVTFKTDALSNHEVVKNNVIIYQNNSQETLFVSNPNNLDVRTIILYDINGKRITCQEKLATKIEYSLSTSGLADAAYIVEIITKENLKLSQKIIISQGK